MYRITKATVVKGGKAEMTFDEVLEVQDIEDYRQEIMERYIAAIMAKVQVYLQYKEIPKDNG
ncbi:MAG: hypothetical protein NC048_02605 [Bacteroides sp.]|nr:hypothetical protein [Bacteroides sp.]MCM1531470.1 hypothetical protein [Ruminococcus flavefaciens]MCM1554368.1 hypothetical protein [Bacteroides sp.]